MISKINFGNIHIGSNDPVVVIAEAACEHLGSPEVAMRMVDAAKEGGADIIKFQLHLSSEMLPGSIQFWAGSMDEVLARYNLTSESHREIMNYCQQVGIQYMCTPFCAAATDILDSLGVLAFKTGSGEMTNIPMLRHMARKKKPMIVSTGMATLQEIEETVSMLKAEGAEFALMHCTSGYPPQYDQINLNFIPRLQEKFGVIAGHSDHTPEIWTALAAVSVGAKIIEKHFTLDRGLKGPDHHISLEPDEFSEMVQAIRKIESALGSEKKVHPEEQEVRQWAHHSVVTLCDIRAGDVLSVENIGVKRPGGGIPAKHLDEIYEKKAGHDIGGNSLLQWDDIV